MVYVPNEKQNLAHCAKEQCIGYGGAMGGGKTRFICEEALWLATKFPGNFGLIARQSGPALKLSTQEVFFEDVLPPGGKTWRALGAKFTKSEGLLTLNNLKPKSKIWFTGLDSDNTERIKSLNLGFFALDEATEISESIFMMLLTRLRRKGIPRMYRKAIISANPEAGWVKRRFLDQKLVDHVFIQAGYKDNPHLPHDYHLQFATMPLTWKQKYLEGSWGAVSGMVYKEFKPEYHIIPTDVLPTEWHHFRGLDHGQQNPASCVEIAAGYRGDGLLEQYIGDRIDALPEQFDEYPVAIVYRLYHATGLVRNHRAAIHHTFKHVARPGLTFGDPSMWRKDRSKIIGDGKQVESSIAEEYLERPYPVTGLVRANNAVIAGVNKVSTLLSIGHLFFMDHDSIEPLIGEAGEIRSYSWKQPKNDDEDWPEMPEKKRDHACDGLRYGIMSMPKFEYESGEVIPYNSFIAAKQRHLAMKKGVKGFAIRKGKVFNLR